jgi:hypothetical protein
MRLATARKMSQAFTEFANQIRATPVPEGLDEEILRQVHTQIDAMARPFNETAEKWRGLADQVIAQQPVEQRETFAAGTGAGWNFENSPSAPRTAVSQLTFDWKPLLDEIRKSPFERQPQESLKAHFEQKGSKRLAAYMNGRLQTLEQQ